MAEKNGSAAKRNTLQKITRNRSLMFLIILTLATTTVGTSLWWYRSHRTTGDDEIVPETVCDAFSKTKIEEIADVRVVSHYLAHTGSTDFIPDLSCTLEFEGFGSVRISYVDDPWFWSIASTKITEERVTAEPENHGFEVDRLDLGLDGNSYFVLNPRQDIIEGYAVWFSTSERTLSINFYELSRNQTLTDDKIKDMTISLLQYTAQAVQVRYPLSNSKPQDSTPLVTSPAKDAN
ncbi:hypothetical protein [Actinomyces capricornis]|uniref:DUF4853 domain-containing protein n=1 Tax=Actinomyces capricornis TaxID=2755559 RepID=A0ABN6K0Y1_9ACTO|nr:hypothetical protein [Actinomyces capricornis]BDA63226.1 hypothetical protein MANAM107_00600 [Actinomyces capricornis]